MSTNRIAKDHAIPIFAVSRERKARIYDGLAVMLLLALMACLGVVGYAASAHADVDPTAQAYADRYGFAVCDTLADYPTSSGLLGIADAIEKDGLSGYQAGEVIALSVGDLCPRFTGLLERFAATYGHQAGQVA